MQFREKSGAALSGGVAVPSEALAKEAGPRLSR